MISEIKAKYQRNRRRNAAQASNAQLCKRWNNTKPTVGRWDAQNNVKLTVLRVGFITNLDRTSYPLVTDLEPVCNERGLEISDLERISGYTRNSIKRFMRDERYIKRFWDLIEGCTVLC